VRKRWGAAALVAPLFMSLVGTAQAAPGPLDEYYSQTIAWAECPAGWVTPSTGVECASVVVPMDYKNPGNGNLEIAISRKKATDPARRRGVLMTNPGGPGGSGLGAVHWFNAQTEMLKIYDVIGMDPRGVGRSTQIRCISTPSDDEFPSRPTDSQLSNWSDYARAIEENCQRGGGEMRRFISTMNTARDMDVIRGAMGEKKISYVGYSYGTQLGAVYGSMFPARLDRSVLDSALDPLKTWHEQDVDVVDAITDNLKKWTEWTAARNGTYGLGTTPAAVRAELDKIAEKLKTAPFGGYSDVSSFDYAVGATRYRRSWAAFSRHIASIKAGAADPAEASAIVAALKKGDIEPTSAGTFQAVVCEWDWFSDVNTYYNDMKRWRDTNPYGGTVDYMAPTNCTFRAFQRPEKIPAITRKYPAGLVVNSDGDTQTPLANGRVMAEHLSQPLISVSNDGQHGHYALRRNTCVDTLVNKYLVSGILPASRVTCAGTDIAETVPPGAAASLGVQSARPLSDILGEIAAETKPF